MDSLRSTLMTADTDRAASTASSRIQVFLADWPRPRNLANAESILLRPCSGVAMDTFVRQHRLRSGQHVVYSDVGCDFRFRVVADLGSVYFR